MRGAQSGAYFALKGSKTREDVKTAKKEEKKRFRMSKTSQIDKDTKKLKPQNFHWGGKRYLS